MDDLDYLLAETGIDTNVEVEVPKSAPKDKEDGQTSSTRKDPKSKPSSSNTGKAADPKKKKRKDSERGTPKAAASSGPSKPTEVAPPGAEKVREPGAHADKKLKGITEYDPAEEVTAADFAAMAMVARLGAEAFNKMRKAVQVNTPGNLAELLKENRTLRTEVEKNVGLLNKLVTAEKEASDNKKKAADLDKVTDELENARNQLAQARKEAKDAEAKAEEAEKKCQAAKKSNAEMAKLGYTRCLSQVLVIDPDFPASKVHLTQKVENGKILGANGQVIFHLPEEKAAEVEEKETGGGEDETPKENAGEN